MATIYDVAKAVGLSHTAVSAVLNNKPSRVSTASRQRIVEAAERLGYRTNRAAQQLATGKFNTIALCFESAWDGLFLHPTVSRLVAGVGLSASENGLFLLFAPSAPQIRFEHTIENLPMHGVDGAIVVGSVPPAAIPAIDRCQIPLVCIDSYTGYAAASTVDQDNRAGMRVGAAHLLANGHRSFAYLTHRLDIQCFVDRLDGFRDAVTEAGVQLDDETVEIVNLGTVRETLDRILDRPQPPTAIVAGEEMITELVLDGLTERGLRIPQDISVLGIDDGTHPHALLDSISAIRSIGYEMGKAAGRLLKEVIDGEHPKPVAIRLEPDVFLRPCPVRR